MDHGRQGKACSAAAKEKRRGHSAGGSEVRRRGKRAKSVLIPGPGHSPQDRSLSVRFDARVRGGFSVYSHCGDDWRACRVHVQELLNGGAASVARAVGLGRSAAEKVNDRIRLAHELRRGAIRAAHWPRSICAVEVSASTVSCVQQRSGFIRRALGAVSAGWSACRCFSCRSGT
jgi:hypothetical protein